MKAKMNRYDLSLWDVRKLSLYGRATNSVQARNSCRLLHWDGLADSTSTKTE
jgi:hypothetical protein